MKELVTKEVDGFLANSSMIRKMFEAGIELRKKYGAENVYDFSLGNPDVPPPAAVKAALKEIAEHADEPFAIGYMPNAGYPATREALAKKVSEEQATEVPASNIVVTCGAAGAINVLFRAVLSEGDEVICPSPYFVEYGFYAGNFGGKLVPVPTKLPNFNLDVEAIDAAITPKTRAVIVNSPNNPTGQIYSREELAALGEVLAKHSEKNGRAIYLVSDEPYRALNFDSVEIPSVFSVYPAAVVIGSFSKTLSLAGERIGYFVAHPSMPDQESLMAAVSITNRTLGYVNAPVIGQKLVQRLLGETVDLTIYDSRRKLMAKVLSNAGIEFAMPKGAFYFFVKNISILLFIICFHLF